MTNAMASAMRGEMTLVLGGARSGKSAYAEQLAASLAPGGRVLYVATAQAWDADMERRIARHRAERPAGWRTLEAPRAVGEAIRAELGQQVGEDRVEVVLVDCLTLLTSNVLLTLAEDLPEAEATGAMQEEIAPLLDAWQGSTAHWIVVSNEVGLGIVPAYPLGRLYRDVLGRVNQQLAAQAQRVIFMVAGLPWQIKPPVMGSGDVAGGV